MLGKITVIDIVQPDRLTLIYDNTLEIFIGDSRKLDYKINFAVRTILERLGDNPRGFGCKQSGIRICIQREKITKGKCL